MTEDLQKLILQDNKDLVEKSLLIHLGPNVQRQAQELFLVNSKGCNGRYKYRENIGF